MAAPAFKLHDFGPAFAIGRQNALLRHVISVRELTKPGLFNELLLVGHGDAFDTDLVIALVVNHAGLEFRMMSTKKRFMAKTFGNIAQFALAVGFLDVAVALQTLFYAIPHHEEVVGNVLLMAVATQRHFLRQPFDLLDIDVILDVIVTTLTRFIRDICKGAAGMTLFTVICNSNVVATHGTHTP